MNKYLGFIYLFCNILAADFVTSVKQIYQDGHLYSSYPYASFNSQTNNFMVSFLADNSFCSLYDLNGNLVQGPKTILTSGDNPIAFSVPISCYNQDKNQFLISYIGWHGTTSTYFSILDKDLNSLVGPIELTNPGLDPNSKLTYCVYNSVNKQYLITWTSGNNNAYFVILDDEGNLLVPTTQIDCAQIGDGRGMSVSYNSRDNQYFFTWQDSLLGYPHFAIYDDGGMPIQLDEIIDEVEAYSTFILSAYNSIDNQYIITWSDINANACFIIYDSNGDPVSSKTIIASNLVDITAGGGVAVSYNLDGNEFLVSFNGSNGTIYYAIYSASGMQKIPLQAIINPSGSLYSILKSNSYALGKNIYLIAWQTMFSGYSNMYFVLYNRNSLTNKLHPLIQGSPFNDYILKNEPRILVTNPICIANPI